MCFKSPGLTRSLSIRVSGAIRLGKFTNAKIVAVVEQAIDYGLVE